MAATWHGAQLETWVLYSFPRAPATHIPIAGGQIAIRISFANFCFFALHALLTLGMTKEGDPRVDLHSGFWAPKLLAWAAALIGFFWVPARAIYGYAQVSCW